MIYILLKNHTFHTYKSCEIVTLATKRVTQPNVTFEVIHIKHQPSNTILHKDPEIKLLIEILFKQHSEIVQLAKFFFFHSIHADHLYHTIGAHAPLIRRNPSVDRLSNGSSPYCLSDQLIQPLWMEYSM